MLTLTWDVDILFEKLTPETPFALCFWGWGFHVKPEMAWMQVNRLGVEGNYVMLPCHSCYIY